MTDNEMLEKSKLIMYNIVEDSNYSVSCRVSAATSLAQLILADCILNNKSVKAQDGLKKRENL